MGIILAAGIGQRLRPLTRDITKTLINVRELTILELILCNFYSAGIKKVIIVVGHGKEKLINFTKQVQRKIPIEVMFTENPIFNKTNTSYSLLIALKEILNKEISTIIAINGDTIFDIKILGKLIHTKTTALVIDNVKILTPESFKVLIREGVIEKMGKDVDSAVANGEFIGLSKIAKEDFEEFFEILDQIVSINPNNYYDFAFQTLSKRKRLDYVHTDGLKWTEVDFLTDLEYAKKIISQMELGKICNALK